MENTNIDYMHSILLGVIKILFEYWFNKDMKYAFSLKNSIKLIDAKLVRIRPPQYVSNCPRMIKTWNNWRAHEFLTFVIYYNILFFNCFQRDYAKYLF